MLRAYRLDRLHSLVVERAAPSCSSTCLAPGAVVRPRFFEEDSGRRCIPVGLIVWAVAAADVPGLEFTFGVLWSGDPGAAH